MIPTSTEKALLAERCEQHLILEERHWGDVLDHGQRLDAVLRERGPKALAEFSAEQTALALSLDELRRRRLELRGELARALGRPLDTANFDQAAALWPADFAPRLAEKREHVRRLAHDAQRLTQQNALVMQLFHEFVHRFIAGVTGSAGAGERYGPAGVITPPAYGPLIQGRG